MLGGEGGGLVVGIWGGGVGGLRSFEEFMSVIAAHIPTGKKWKMKF